MLAGLSCSCSSCLSPATCFSTSHFSSPPPDSPCLLTLLHTLVALLLKFKRKKIKSWNMQRAPESNGSGIANSAKCACQEGNLTSCMMAPEKRKKKKKKKKMALQAHHISPNYTSWSATPSCMCKSSLNTHTSGMKDRPQQCVPVCIPQGHPFSHVFGPKERD